MEERRSANALRPPSIDAMSDTSAFRAGAPPIEIVTLTQENALVTMQSKELDLKGIIDDKQ